jgi:hypothetical protein
MSVVLSLRMQWGGDQQLDACAVDCGVGDQEIGTVLLGWEPLPRCSELYPSSTPLTTVDKGP